MIKHIQNLFKSIDINNEVVSYWDLFLDQFHKQLYCWALDLFTDVIYTSFFT